MILHCVTMTESGHQLHRTSTADKEGSGGRVKLRLRICKTPFTC